MKAKSIFVVLVAALAIGSLTYAGIKGAQTQEDIITASDFDSIRSVDDEGNMTIGF